MTITAYTSHGLLKESSGMHFLSLTHGHCSAFDSLALSEVLNGPRWIGAHGEEAYEWCLRIALFPSGLEIEDHALSVPFTHVVCDVLTSLMQRPVRTP